MKLLRYWPRWLALGIVFLIGIAAIRPISQRAVITAIHEKGGRIETESGIISRRIPSEILFQLRRPFENYAWSEYFDVVVWAHFPEPEFGDYEVKRIAQFKKLRGIGLQNSGVTDTGLAYLNGLTEIVEVNLRETEITDAGLEHLRGLTSLEGIYLERSNVTDQGVARLKAALPDCEIYH